MNASGNPALVLNADFRPLSYYPLSLCSLQDAVKSDFLNRVSVIEQYDQFVNSTTISFKLPSVIALKDYVMPQRKPAFTRFNVFLRDNFTCQYCSKKFAAKESFSKALGTGFRKGLNFKDVETIKLNDNILRSETAAISALSVINFIIN